jgi:hypothetical protein
MILREKKMQQIAVKDRTDFDKKLQQYQIIFAEAKDKVMYDLKDDIQDSSSFALVVVRCTQAIKCHEELHGYETDDMIVDLVHNVITSMPISSVEKDKIKNLYYPTILSIVNSLTAANKHYLSLKSKKDTEAAKKKQRKRRTRSIRSEAAPETLGVVADSAAPIIDMVALVQEVYHTATNGIRQRRLSAGTIISIGSQLMQIVEQYPQLSGTQKKEVVISVIHKIIEASDLTSQEKEDLTFVVDTVLSLVVNFIVKAYNGEIPFVNNIVEKVTNCFGKCCGSSE